MGLVLVAKFGTQSYKFFANSAYEKAKDIYRQLSNVQKGPVDLLEFEDNLISEQIQYDYK